MNKLVEEFIEKKEKEILDQKEIQKEKKLERRNNHLIKLGIVDQTKIKKTGNFYYEDSYDALDVSDEEYALICKYAPEEQKIEKDEEDIAIAKDREKALRSVADTVLFISIVVCVALSLIGLIISEGHFFGMYFAYAIIILISSIIIRSVAHVLANISSTLKKINAKIEG